MFIKQMYQKLPTFSLHIHATLATLLPFVFIIVQLLHIWSSLPSINSTCAMRVKKSAHLSFHRVTTTM